MADSVVVVAVSSLTMYYGVLYIVTIPVGISGINLVLDAVEFFYESLELIGLGGFRVCFLDALGFSMLCKYLLVFDFSKGCFL